ncbi:MAG: chalcone isomerase family protein [Hydrogenophaga sp.]
MTRHVLSASMVTAVLAAALCWPAQAGPVEPTAADALNGKQTVGSSLFRYWGFEVYQATLQARAGFDATRYAQQRFALELQYRRAFKGRDIAQRSIEEMQAIAPMTAQQLADWPSILERAFPDIRPGDRLLGVHVPGSGARFYFNGRLHTTVDDPDFSARFFGIWLSPSTSAPQLRAALIGATR